MSEFDDQDPPTDYSGLIIGLILMPLLPIFKHFGRYDLGLSAFICLGMILIAIRLRWELRTQVWFWVTIAVVLALHVPVILLVPWPHMTINHITLLPIGLVDFAIVSGAIQLVEDFMGEPAPSDDEE